jgi:tRNA(adenine34) deaminase
MHNEQWYKDLDISTGGTPTGIDRLTAMSPTGLCYCIIARDNVIERVDVYEDSKRTHYKKFKYDNSGRVIENMMYSPDGNDNWHIVDDIWYYVYDEESGLRVKKIMQALNATTAREILYDKEGNRIQETTILSRQKQEELVQRAMALAAETATEGNLPFAALLIDSSGTIVIEAKNTVNSTKNAAAHAEINLLFQSSKKLMTNDLSDYAIVSNAASCPMCATALIKAKIVNYYYGALNENRMVPNITMSDVIDRTPFPINVHGGILAKECAEQVRLLAQRSR